MAREGRNDIGTETVIEGWGGVEVSDGGTRI